MAKLSAQSLLALREDVVELRELLKEATRPNVQRHLSNRIVDQAEDDHLSRVAVVLHLLELKAVDPSQWSSTARII